MGERRDDPGVAEHEGEAPAGHVKGLREGMYLHADLLGALNGEEAQWLAVKRQGVVRRVVHNDNPVPAGELDDLLEELHRCACARRVVRVVYVQEFRGLQVLLRYGVEVRQKAVLLLERQLYRPAAVPLPMVALTRL